MKDNEKTAKLKALKSINSSAKSAISKSLDKYKDKDSSALKKHIKEMSEDTEIDFKNDSEHITDPMTKGNVVGRHVSDEEIDCHPDDMSVYDIDERLEKLMKKKKQAKKAAGIKE